MPGAGVNLVYNQPAFHPNIRGLTAPFNSQNGTVIQRGFMLWDPSVMGTTQGYSYNANSLTNWPVVQFLYNPSTVSASYALSNSTVQASIIFPTSTNNQVLNVPMQQNVQFTLYFDRTMEMYDQSWRIKQPPGQNNQNFAQMGVEADIIAMKQFTGMFINANSLQSGSNNNNPYQVSGTTVNFASYNGRTNVAAQGVMTVCPSYLFFSGTGTANSTATGAGAIKTNAAPKGLWYYGYIDSWDVQYTHFTQDMVPMRAVVDVDFQLIPQPSPFAGNTSTVSQAQQQALATVSPTAPAITSTAGEKGLSNGLGK